jgi:CheY-like chemotaxis protein
MRECLALVAPQARDRDIELIDRDGHERYVRGDKQRIKQVMLNLLSNAIKYNREGGTVTLTCDVVGDAVRIAVTDTGPGLTPEHLKRLFTPFDRLDAESKGVEGTGLGLALSKRLVESMGGTLGVESQLGRGSTFWLELASTTSPEATTTVAAPKRVRTPSRSSATLLYIEDNLANLRIVERIMSHWPGVRLISALQGSIGLDLARQHRPDLILLDVNLPDVPGDVVLQRLMAEPSTSGIPVVMISADATPGQIQRFRDIGAANYLTKPIDLPQFLALLEDHLDRGVELRSASPPERPSTDRP